MLVLISNTDKSKSYISVAQGHVIDDVNGRGRGGDEGQGRVDDPLGAVVASPDLVQGWIFAFIRSVLWIRIRSNSHSFGSLDPNADPDPKV